MNTSLFHPLRGVEAVAESGGRLLILKLIVRGMTEPR